MATIYGKVKSETEIKDHIVKYYESVKIDKNGRFNRTIDLFPKSIESVLDYGCGWGHYSYELAQRGYKVTGIDLIDNEIDISRLVWGNKDNLKFEKLQITSIPDNSFDSVLSAQVIEHVHNVGNFVSEISRVLKPNGFLILSLPNVMNPRYFLSLMNRQYEDKLLETSEFYLDNYQKQHHHVNSWDPFHLTILLASLGYRLIEYKGSEGIPLPSIKLLPKYITGGIAKSTLLRNYSYTMQFLFQYVKNVEISNLD